MARPFMPTATGPRPRDRRRLCGLRRDATYSSGHPAPNSRQTNPFGLIKSRDGGRSWQKLGLEGESDFHLLAASHGTNAVYVFNPQPNSRMRQVGLHYTLDDGRT